MVAWHALRAAGSSYCRHYRAALRQPFVLVLGQLSAFFAISLYVKFIEMRLTPDYDNVSVGSGQFGWHYLLFSHQEILLFGLLIAGAATTRRYAPRLRQLWLAGAWTLGFVALPFLSLVEVLGLGHFAMFLTPLGPEEVRLIGWSRHLISSGNILRLPAIACGIVLITVGYYGLPPALWLDRRRLASLAQPASLALFLSVAAFTALIPKPHVADALLIPHPIVWLVSGARPQQIWEHDRSTEVVPGCRSARHHLEPTERPRNIVIVLLESTRAASVALYNPSASAGRSLLALRDETVVFDQLYAPVPTSAHALFSILYGVYPYLGPFWMGSDRSVVADSMAQMFGRAGYATHLYVTADLNFDDMRSFATRGFERVRDPNDWPGQERYQLLEWGRDDRLLFEEIKRTLVEGDSRPRFLLAFTSNTHHPYPLTELLNESAKTPQEAYERLVAFELDLVVDLYQWMKQHGVADNTLLLVLGDHGEAFGEHPGNFGHAAFIYEENVHIPGFILHPRRLGLPQHIAQLGSQVDLRATITDILGMNNPEPTDGMSLLRSDPHRLIAHFTENGVSYFGVRDQRFSYIYTPHAGVDQLFDRRRDAGETTNLSDRFPTVTARYRTHLQRWEARHQLSLARVLR
ncbi:MAG TPA: sulfatase-like hydrolase/transferase [Candidatus Binatia bacterium]|nr:sulfatase-like hydrolase/transferase [Candidatus Binatia bacterium]